jgi:competence protein ComGC
VKTNKGFTLVEMLGVLVILIMTFMLGFPLLTKMIKDNNDKMDTATVSVIEQATADYLTEKSNVYPKGNDYTYCITLTDLIDNANLTEKQISSLNDKTVIVKTTFSNSKPTYVLTKTCTPVVVDIDFTLIGEKNMSFEVGDGGQYVEPGATALNKAGQAVSYTVTVTNSKKETIEYVDTTKVDIYTVKYSATIDGKDYSIERIVKVVDTTVPTITVNPTSETISIINNSYNVLSGVSASDNSGDIPTIKASTNLSLGQAGTYFVTYTATDSSGNQKTAKRTVIISNSSLVNVTLLGDTVVNHYTTSGAYTDAGATAVDTIGTNLTSSLVKTITNSSGVVSNVAVDKDATYYITYSIIKDGVTYSETRRVNIIAPPTYIVYANGTAVYFNPVSGAKCTAGEAVSTTGTKTGCMKWYTFNDTGNTSETINLLLDHNTNAFEVWSPVPPDIIEPPLEPINFTLSDNTKSEFVSLGNPPTNVNGPDLLLWTLDANTSSWAGVPTRTDSYTLNNGTADYTIYYSDTKARLITAAEIATITGNSSFVEQTTPYTSWFYLDSNNQTQTATTQGASNYDWLFDYTSGCTLYGCSVNDASTSGYWTATATAGGTTNAWIVGKNGRLSGTLISSNNYAGVRPVITISKLLLQ